MAERVLDVDRNENESTENTKAPLYDHPVFREISLSNGKINKMKKDEVKKELKERRLDSRGVKEVLQKRLKNHIKKEKLAQAKLEQEKRMNEVHFYCVIDFEGTCEEKNPNDYIHEIIEFPAVLLDAVTLEKVSEFHKFCKPQDKPELSQFCQNLTGITQEMVDNADTFPGVLDNFDQWLKKHELGSEYKFAVVTDGPSDMKRFFSEQCQLCSIPIPKYARKWINLKKLYRNFYKVKNLTLGDMVNNLGLKFEGRPHCGMDDARNIARVLRKMVQDGCEIKFNESLYGNT